VSDPLRTRICDLLGIEVPIVQAGMGYVARAELVAAVSNAGGLGVLGGAGFAPERLRLEIRRCRELTDRPFGVDLLLPVQTTGEVLPARPPHDRPVVDPADLEDGFGEFAVGKDGRPVRPEELMQIVLEEAPPVFAAGLGNPGPWVELLHRNGTVVMGLVGTARAAAKVAAAGADIVIAQGTEGGGHTSRVATSAIVPACVAAVGDVPVLAAGGITTGAGIAAALAMGAEGVWLGTRFVASREAFAHENYKAAIVGANEDSTLITRSYSGKPMRAIRNRWTDDWESRPHDILPFPRQFKNSKDVYVVARRDGITDVGSMPCGQGAWAIDAVESAGDIVGRLADEARSALRRQAARSGA